MTVRRLVVFVFLASAYENPALLLRGLTILREKLLEPRPRREDELDGRPGRRVGVDLCARSIGYIGLLVEMSLAMRNAS